VTCFVRDAASKIVSPSTGALVSAFLTPNPCVHATLPPSIHVTHTPGTGATLIQSGREVRNSLGGALFQDAANAGAASVARKLRRYITGITTESAKSYEGVVARPPGLRGTSRSRDCPA